MDKDKKKAILILSLLGLAAAIFLVLVFVLDKWYFKLIFAILAIIPAVILIRAYISYKRKKLVFSGKVLVIKKPDSKLVPKWIVIMKNGKISKKFFTLEEPEMKVGKTYVVAYEEKSNVILKVENPQIQMLKATDLKSNPKFR